jgi:condensin-2 complex subunit H2
MAVTDEQLTEKRFAHLLQPIRDLADNWNIDIAKDLEDYLAELEEITFQFDGVNKTLNFAEAALLIQGSASIYSKKVEYLYLLIYKTLELLVEKRKQKFQKQPSSVQEDGKDADVEKDDIEMIPLDDVLEEASGIDLDEETQPQSQSKTLERCSLDFIRASGAFTATSTLTEEGVNSNNNNSEFKVNSCRISNAGALIFDHTLEFLTASNSNSHETTSVNNMPTEDQKQISENMPMEISEETVLNALNEGDIPLASLTSNNNEREDDVQSGLLSADKADTSPELSSVTTTNDAINNKNLKTRIKNSTILNPWETLDPHDPEGIPEKTLKKGRTWRLPAGTTLNNTKTPKKVEATESLLFSKILTTSIIDHPLLVDYTNGNYLMRPFFNEFQYLYDTNMKKWAQAIRQNKRTRAVQTMAEIGTDLWDSDLEEAVNDNIFVSAENIAEEDIVYGGDVGNCNAVDFPAETDEGVGNMFKTDDQQTEHEIGQNYEELCRKHIENYLTATEQFIRESELSKRVQEWNEKLEPLLREQESRPPFDIRKYSENVIELLHIPNANSKGQSVPFREIIRSKAQPYDICRIFVTCLQLANSGNVEICTERTAGPHVNNVSLRLLSEQLHFEELDSWELRQGPTSDVSSNDDPMQKEQGTNAENKREETKDSRHDINTIRGSKTKKQGEFVRQKAHEKHEDTRTQKNNHQKRGRETNRKKTSDKKKRRNFDNDDINKENTFTENVTAILNIT